MVIALGLVWASVGIVMSRVAVTGTSPITFYAAGSWITTIFCWSFIADWNVLLAGLPPRFYDLLFWMVIAGIVNSVGQILLIVSMRNGHKGISWAIVQTAMLIPFLASIIIWNEKLTVTGVIGMLCFLCAIYLMGKGRSMKEKKKNEGKNEGTPISIKWIMLVAGSLLFLGLTQTLQSVTSHWVDWSDAARLRIPLFVTTTAVINTIAMFCIKQRVNVKVLRHASIWAVFAISSYLILFKSLDVLAPYSMSGCVFPLGQSICMVCFTLYSGFILKESFSRPVKLGLICSLAGIVLLAIR